MKKLNSQNLKKENAMIHDIRAGVIGNGREEVGEGVGLTVIPRADTGGEDKGRRLEFEEVGVIGLEDGF